MPSVEFTSALRRFFPDLKPENVEGQTVKEVLAVLDEKYPGLRDYIVDDQGALRQHVNIFLGNEIVRDKTNLSDRVERDDQIFIFQALSGG
jgi:molybdopterin synthase sulfur carrier subunit